jgi:glycosyltransferase involved in cell wall biosynthesis
MSADPAVTVLMTVYNGGRFLAEAIRSILSQGFREYEFLIVDDASSDGSVSVLKDFAAKDTRIRLLLNVVNKGQTACLNQGLRDAKGKWIARQDADDLSLPGRLDLQWEAAQKTSDLMIIGVNGWVIDELGACTGMIHAPLIDQGIRWSLPFRNPFIHAGVMFRREWPDGGSVLYDEGFQICQDWDLWARLLEKGGGVNLPQRLVAYRHQDGSLSHGNLEKTRRETEAITARVWSKSFPKHKPNQELLSSFREGLDSRHQGDFWYLYDELRKEWDGKQISQAMAVHRLQAAGAFGVRNPGAMMFEVLKAVAADPGWTIKTLRDGIFRPQRITA